MVRAGGAVLAPKIAGDAAGRHPGEPCRRDEDVGEVAGVGALGGERFGRGGVRGVVVAGDVRMHAGEEAMQHVEGTRLGDGKFGGIGGERAVGAGQGGLAQKEGRREPLHRAAHHAGGVLGLDLALHHDAKLRDRAARRERMGEVAERILIGFEPAVGGDLDPPVHHVLAGVVAWGEPQRLDHAGARRFVTVERFVRDADAHGQSSNPRRTRFAGAPQSTSNIAS